MKSSIVIFCILQWCAIALCNAQGKTHHFLLGYDVGLADTNVTSTKARFLIDSNSIITVPGKPQMPFDGAQANISDENGNLIIATNGCWIADATGDTMLNGGGLNPSNVTSQWCNNTSGLLLVFQQTYLYLTQMIQQNIFYFIILGIQFYIGLMPICLCTYTHN